jgi:hypothetical protein
VNTSICIDAKNTNMYGSMQMSKKYRAAQTATKAPKSARTTPQAQRRVDAASEAPAAVEDAKPARDAKSAGKAKATQSKKLSAIDSAAQVLAAKGEPMTAPELIAAMAEQGLWSSPGGKTPAATLYAAMLREITTKGAQSRFSRPGRGKFASTGKV